MWRWVSGLFGSLLVLLGAAQASAGVPVGTPVATCILPAKPGMTAAALFATPGRFDCARPQHHYGSGDFWILSRPLPRDAIRRGSVRIASLWQHSVTLYIRYADGHIRRVGFTSATAGRHLALGAIVALPLPDDAGRPVRLLWHVTGAANVRGTIIGAALVSDADGTRMASAMALFYGAFAGMAIALIVYNLALWGALRQAFQPTYCLLLLFLLGYEFTSSGAAGQWLPWLDNNDRLRLNGIFLSGSSASALLFARTFFEPRVFAGWLRPASSAVMAAILAASWLFVIAAPWHIALLDGLISASYILLMALVPAILWRAWRLRSHYLWLFALAWGSPIALAGLRIASAVNLVGWSFWLDNSTILSMALEAMLSSLAIAYRIRLLSRERDTARDQEIAARLLAATDPLTGLLNRRAFLDRAIGREGDQVLLLADIDHFKRVNETIGHDGGDEVLRVLARALRASVPADALVARLGGEEFAIVAPAGTLEAAAVLDALRRERMPYDLSVTASIGTCTGPLTREVDWKALYRRADRALFDAKAAGRDRVRDAGRYAVAA